MNCSLPITLTARFYYYTSSTVGFVPYWIVNCRQGEPRSISEQDRNTDLCFNQMTLVVMEHEIVGRKPRGWVTWEAVLTMWGKMGLDPVRGESKIENNDFDFHVFVCFAWKMGFRSVNQWNREGIVAGGLNENRHVQHLTGSLANNRLSVTACCFPSSPAAAAAVLGSCHSWGEEGGEEWCGSKPGQRTHPLQVKQTDLNWGRWANGLIALVAQCCNIATYPRFEF